MATNIFGAFEHDRRVLDASRAFWREVVESIAERHGQGGEWAPWIPRTFASGIPIDDQPGNPIADGRSSRSDRAFRIIQHPPDEGPEVGISAWLEILPDDETDLPSQELVIGLIASLESALIAAELLDLWVQGSDLRVVQEWIDARLK